jgi:hypothetical protein
MSGQHDPCRITTFELTKPEVYRWVKAIAKTDLAENDWEWGRSPHDREDPALDVSSEIPFPSYLARPT